MVGTGLNEHGRDEVLDNDRMKRARSNQILGRRSLKDEVPRTYFSINVKVQLYVYYQLITPIESAMFERSGQEPP